MINDRKILSDSEWTRLENYLLTRRGERDSIMLRLAMYTAARQVEIVNMRAEDFDADRVSVTIYGAKRSKDRSIDLAPDFFVEIMDYIMRNMISPGDRVFPITTRQFQRIWNDYRPNRTKTAHCTRHTMACKIYLVSRDILQTAHQLGHKELNNTRGYLEYVEGRLDRGTLMAKARKAKLG